MDWSIAFIFLWGAVIAFLCLYDSPIREVSGPTAPKPKDRSKLVDATVHAWHEYSAARKLAAVMDARLQSDRQALKDLELLLGLICLGQIVVLIAATVILIRPADLPKQGQIILIDQGPR